MWVKITGSESNPWWQGDRFHGALNSLPLVLSLEPGDEIEFGPEHIMAIRKARRSGSAS
jgi:hypothetical protein